MQVSKCFILPLRQPHRVTPGRTNNSLIHPLEKTYRVKQILYKGEVGVGEDGGGCGGWGGGERDVTIQDVTNQTNEPATYCYYIHTGRFFFFFLVIGTKVTYTSIGETPNP